MRATQDSVPVPTIVLKLMLSSMLILFSLSSLRHGLFESHAWDLGIFDQPLYLLSRGLPPISSLLDFHILGDHAAWIFYPLSLLYWLYPSVHWLFVVQAVALSLGAWPTWQLAMQAGVARPQAIALSIAYLLYPLIFNLNLFDFHPEVIALPLILTAVWMARANRVWGFTLCIVVALGCRDALSLTVAAMGVWLWGFERRPRCGAIALISGISWLFLATQVIIPQFQSKGVLGAGFYASFGETVPEIALNMLLRPDLVARYILTWENAGYLVILIAPLAWGLVPHGPKAPADGMKQQPRGAGLRVLAPLVAALPQLLLNLLSPYPMQKNLINQYSLPILPFLLLTAIATLAAGRSWLVRPRWIVLWSLVGFVALGQVSLFGGRYLRRLDTWQASQRAIARITTSGGVLAPAALVPHLSHRVLIHPVTAAAANLDAYEYVLLNQRHPGSLSSPEAIAALLQQVRQNPQFVPVFQQDGVVLFRRMR
jgi:uncharacterized membrane protein